MRILILKLLLLSLVVCSSLFLTGCSTSVSFIVENLSRDIITIKYETKNPNWSSLTPYISDLNSKNSNKGEEWRKAATEDFKIDKEKGMVEVNLRPNQGLRVASEDPYYISKDPYGDHFNLKNLSIVGKNGSIKLEGNQVFEMFQPESKGWSFILPNYPNYVLRYKESEKKEQ